MYAFELSVPCVKAATRMLGLLESASSQQALLEMSEFYNDAVNEPDFNIKEDYKHWNTVSLLLLFYTYYAAGSTGVRASRHNRALLFMLAAFFACMHLGAPGGCVQSAGAAWDV
jgi:hypothetical protein